MPGTIMIVDDEKQITDSYALFLKREGIADSLIFNDPREFITALDSAVPSAVFLDLQMPYYSGEDLLEIVKSKHPNASVLIITGNNDVESAVRCIRKGAMDYIVKPLDKDRFSAAYNSAVNAYLMRTEIDALRKAMSADKESIDSSFCGITTGSAKMKELFRYVEAVAKSSFPVLVNGETGTGKELFAQAVHKCSGRKGEFIAVNVSGLDDTMFTDTLFGHVKGAFTGADKIRKGLLAAAEGGTLLLDEIGDLNETAQIKLLRLLQEKVYMPLGSDHNIRCNVRIVAATNADLTAKVRQGAFRQDLLYRLTTHSITIPPLRDRADDIPALAEIFYQQALGEMGINKFSGISPVIISSIRKYRFPGNVRQLQALMADMAAVFSGREMTNKEVAGFLKEHGIHAETAHQAASEICEFVFSGTFPTLKDMEQYLVDTAVKKSGGNISTAARMLGITRQALHKRLRLQKDSDISLVEK